MATTPPAGSGGWREATVAPAAEWWTAPNTAYNMRLRTLQKQQAEAIAKQQALAAQFLTQSKPAASPEVPQQWNPAAQVQPALPTTLAPSKPVAPDWLAPGTAAGDVRNNTLKAFNAATQKPSLETIADATLGQTMGGESLKGLAGAGQQIAGGWNQLSSDPVAGIGKIGSGLLQGGISAMGLGVGLLPKALGPVLNAFDQGLESTLSGTRSTVAYAPKTALPKAQIVDGKVVNAAEMMAALKRTAPNFDPVGTIGDLTTMMTDPKRAKAEYETLAAEQAVNGVPKAESLWTVASRAGAEYGNQYVQKYMASTPWVDKPPGNPTAAQFAEYQVRNIGYSGPEAQKKAAIRIIAGEDPTVAMRGRVAPAKDASNAEQADYATKVQEYMRSHALQARQQAINAGSGLEQANQIALEAMDEAGRYVNAMGMVPGEENPLAEAVIQTMGSMINKVDPLSKLPLHKLFGIPILTKAALKFKPLGKLAQGLENASPVERAKGQAEFINQVYDAEAVNLAGETMAERVPAGIAGTSVGDLRRVDKFTQALNTSTSPVVRGFARTYLEASKLGQRNESGRANYQNRLTLETVSQLVQGAQTPEQAMTRIQAFVANPQSLLASNPELGNLPISIKAEVARPVFKAALDKLPKLDSLQNPDFNPRQFIAEFSQLSRRETNTLQGVQPADSKSALMKFGSATKAVMGEMFLRWPGYVLRNMAGDYGTMAMDGVMTMDSTAQVNDFLKRVGITTAEITNDVDALGQPKGRPSLLNKIPILRDTLAKTSDAVGNWNEKLELGRRSRATYAAARQFLDVNWKPTISPEAKVILGDLAPQFEAHLKGALTPAELKAVSERVLNPKHAGDTFSAPFHMAGAGVSSDALSPFHLTQIEAGMQDLASKGATPEQQQEYFNQQRYHIDQQHRKNMIQMGEVINPRKDTMGIVRGDVDENQALANDLANQLMRSGMMTAEQARAEVDALVRPVVEGEKGLIAMREKLGDVIGKAGEQVDPDRMGMLVNWALNKEYELRDTYRKEQARLYQTAIATINDRKRSPTAAQGWGQQAWNEYRTANKANADGMHRNIRDTLAWVSSTIDQTSTHPETWDSMIAGQPGIESTGTYADRMITEARQLMDEKGREVFDQTLLSNRTAMDVNRREAYRQMQVAAKSDPSLTGHLFDVVSQAESDVRDHATLTAGLAQAELARKDAGEIGEVERAEAANALWTRHFEFAAKRYGDYSQAQLRWAEVRNGKTGKLLARLGYKDTEIADLFKRMQDEEGAATTAERAAIDRLPLDTQWQVVPDEDVAWYRQRADAEMRDDGGLTMVRRRPVVAPVVPVAPETARTTLAEDVQAAPDAALPTPAEPATTGIERPRIAREEVAAQLKQAFAGLKPEEHTAAMAVLDARAASWASRTGRSVDEWYASRIAGVEGGEGGVDSLQQAQPNAPDFYSQLARTLEQKLPNRATPEQIAGLVKGAQIKADELKWTGFEDWLNARPKGEPIDKAEALAAIQLPQIKEITKVQDADIDYAGLEPFTKEVDDSRARMNEIQSEVLKAVKASGAPLPRYAMTLDELIAAGLEPYAWERDRRTETANTRDRVFHDVKLVASGGVEGRDFSPEYAKVLSELPVKEWADQYDAALAAWQKAGQDRQRAGEAIDKAARKAGKPRFSEYTLYGRKSSGGNNYREVVLQLPGKQNEFQSAHWKEPNVLAHTRLADYTDTEGKKVLMVEEIQSDWHQAGRDKGYEVPADTQGWTAKRIKVGLFEVFDPAGASLGESRATSAAQAIESAGKGLGTGEIPQAPLSKTWHEHVFRRILRDAVEQGYDRVAWTTGKQQSERYDLNKSLSSIKWERASEGTYRVTGQNYGDPVFDSQVSADKLRENFGAEIARQITDSTEPSGVIRGAGLEVGGGGMKSFYDKTLPDYAAKYGKKWGATVGQTELTVGGAKWGEHGIVHSIDITPAMRDSIQREGQPFFQNQGGETPGRVAGSVEFLDDGRAVIRAMNAPDISTVVHEIGHVFRRDLAGDDALIAAEWAGAKLGDDGAHVWDRSAEEKFARGFEEYLSTGKAPTAGLRAVFDQFKTWLTTIYAKMRGVIDKGLSPEMRGVYDRLLSEQIDATRPPPTVEGLAALRNADITTPEGLTALMTEARAGRQTVQQLADYGDTAQLKDAAKQLPDSATVAKWLKPDGSARGDWNEGGGQLNAAGKVGQADTLVEQEAVRYGLNLDQPGGVSQAWFDKLTEAKGVHREIKAREAGGITDNRRVAKAAERAYTQWDSLTVDLQRRLDALQPHGQATDKLREMARQAFETAGGDVDSAIERLSSVMETRPDAVHVLMDTLQELQQAQPATVPVGADPYSDVAGLIKTYKSNPTMERLAGLTDSVNQLVAQMNPKPAEPAKPPVRLDPAPKPPTLRDAIDSATKAGPDAVKAVVQQAIPRQPDALNQEQPLPDAAMPGTITDRASQTTASEQAKPATDYGDQPDPDTLARQMDAGVEAGGTQQEPPHFKQMADSVRAEGIRAIDAIEKGFTDHLGKWQPGEKVYPAEQRAVLEAEVNRLAGEQGNVLAAMRSDARERTTFSLTDYADKRGFDNWLGLIAPFSYWATRQGRNFALRMINNPSLMAAYYRYKQAMERENKKRGAPARMEGTLNIPGTDVYVDPMNVLFPFGNLMGSNIVNDSDQARTALQSTYDFMGTMGLRPSPAIDIPLRLSNLLVSKSPGDEGYGEEMATYGKGSVGQIAPITGVIQGATAMAGIGGPTGVDIEGPVRKAIGLPEAEQFDAYRIARSVSDMAAAQNARDGTLDPRPYLAAQEFIDKHGQKDLPTALKDSTPEQVAEELRIDVPMATEALRIAREAANKATVQRGVSQLAGAFAPVRAMQLPDAEQTRLQMKATERAAAFNPTTGVGSKADVKAVQAALPAIAVQRAQYGALPGDEGDNSWQYEKAQKAYIDQQFDSLKDAVIAQRPWDRKATRAIEDARWRAKGNAERTKAAGSADWQKEYAEAIAKITGTEMASTALGYDYKPTSIAGATPTEALQIRRDEIMRYVSYTQPNAEAFTQDDGTIDFPAYYAAKDAWTANLGLVAQGIPQVAAILTQAGAEGMGKRMENFMSGLNGDALAAYYRRNDTALEAIQRAYHEGLYQPTMDAFGQLQEAGDPEAFNKTLGGVGPLTGAQLIPIVKEMYGKRFTDADLAQAATVQFPPLVEVMRANMSDVAKRKDVARSKFWELFQGDTPPGRVGAKLRDIPIVTAALDQSSRATMTPEQYDLALALMKGWVVENVGEVTPAIRAEWAEARAQRKQLDLAILSQVGQQGVQLLQQYEQAPTAADKEAIRRSSPLVTKALNLRLQFARKNKTYSKYYQSAGGSGGIKF